MTVVIGLSGGIGSGKSTIAQIFAKMGAKVINADELAHQELNKKTIKESLQSRFGHVIINKDGQIDRHRLAEIVFKNKEDLAYLESCIHPGVRQEIETQVAYSQAPVIVLDVPLLETSPIMKLCTHKVFVKVPDRERYKRVAKRGWSEAHWQMREAQQMPVAEKMKTADLVVDNSGDLKNVETQIKTWIKTINASQ